MTECLGKWVASYYTEARRAIRGIGKYRLAPEYEHFYVEPVQWVQWSHDRRNQLYLCEEGQKKFAYKKPKDAGKKPEGTGKKPDVLGYHNHNYFQKYLKINKLDQINEY